MGYYINGIGNSFEDKKEALLAIGSQIIETPTEFQKNLVCLIDNGLFAAAAFAHSEAEMEYFKRPDGRKRIWLIVPNAKQLAK